MNRIGNFAGGKLGRLWICASPIPTVAVNSPGKPMFSGSNNTITEMKVSHKTRTGERREVLLKEYFITSALIALLKRAGAEAARFNATLKPAPVPVRIRH